jgi:hypothetical protein
MRAGAMLDEVTPNRLAQANDLPRLRGLPAVGGRGSLGGVIAGTRPGREAIRRVSPVNAGATKARRCGRRPGGLEVVTTVWRRQVGGFQTTS